MNSEQRIAARNRKARHDYHVVDTWKRAGSDRKRNQVHPGGKVSLSGSHAGFDDSGELYVWA
jgi:tmRNA-binding protein